MDMAKYSEWVTGEPCIDNTRDRYIHLRASTLEERMNLYHIRTQLSVEKHRTLGPIALTGN